MPKKVTNLTPLEKAKLKATQQIDSLAEVARSEYSSGGPGQSMVYQSKFEEAADYVAAGYPVANLANYPFLAAETDAMQKPANQVADDILAARTAWMTPNVAIEKIRLIGKRNVTLAANQAQVRQALRTAIVDLRKA